VREVKRYRPSPLASSEWVAKWNDRTNRELREAKDRFIWLCFILLINIAVVAIMFALNW